MSDSAMRTLVLLVGTAALALAVGSLLGTLAALWRRHSLASGTVIGVTSLVAGVPAFFVAYFLQIAVILIGASATSRDRLLPVYGFGYDEHLVLPLLSLAIPAIASTAQLTAVRTSEVLDAEFVVTATAKGLGTWLLLRRHVLPHVRPILLEGLGSGLRMSVASLPIVEYLFLWRGIGQVALESVGVRDAAAFSWSSLVLAAVFALLSVVADLARPRALFQRTA